MLNHTTLSCCYEGCFAVITLHPEEERRLRRTHEDFYCPAGHVQAFRGKTKDQKEIERLERERDRAWKRVHRLNDDLYDLRENLVRGVQVCPLGCGWHARRQLRWRLDDESIERFLDRVGRDLTDHLIREHNATLAPVALLEAGDVGAA